MTVERDEARWSAHAKLRTLLRKFSVAAFLLLLPALASAGDFLWLSDIHFDPLADPQIVEQLAAAEAGQWRAILDAGSAKFPGYGADTSWPLLASVLEASAKTQPDSAFTIATGDLLAHHLRERFNGIASAHDDPAFRSFVRKTVAFLTLELKQSFPNKPVFVALGNNDDECGDYALQPNGPFLHDTAPFTTGLAGVADSADYARYGVLSAANPALKKHRIIVLNTVFFSARYHDACEHPSEDPAASELAWLAAELAHAQAHHEKVWLVYHIPPGIDAYATTHPKQPSPNPPVVSLWKETYTSQFLQILAQFPSVTGPNFAGHIHADDFRLLAGAGGGAPFVIDAPPVSPITGQNPSFRTVEFDSSGQLLNQSTYFLKNLLETAAATPPDWEREYNFQTAFQLPSSTRHNIRFSARRSLPPRTRPSSGRLSMLRPRRREIRLRPRTSADITALLAAVQRQFTTRVFRRQNNETV